MAKSARLKVIPKPLSGTRAVLTNNNATPGFLFFAGNNTNAPDFLCGSCGRVLARGTPRSAMGNLIVHCPSCDAYNDSGVAPN
jgi:hypothetical protein